MAVLEEMGNPFLKHSQDQMAIDTRDIMDTQVAETVRKIETLGEEQYAAFVSERLEQCTTPITQTIPKNKLPLFSRPPIKGKSQEKEQLAALKSDIGLFSRLYISCQTRDGDLDNFFSHENQASPPALSTQGKIRLCVKADLLHCLESDLPENNCSAPVSDAIILDGAVVVKILSPGTLKTFQEYGEMVFASYIHDQLKKSNRIDLVWDVYLPASLKASTREKRGKGKRKRVAPSTALPRNWMDFLRVSENKTELFSLSSNIVAHLPLAEGKEVYVTDGSEVLCSPAGLHLARLAPCSQEEADTLLLLHAADAVHKGCMKVTIRTVDTDVVVLAVASFSKIATDELWLAFGVGSSFRYPIHEMAASMNPAQCLALSVFHAFTGCDTVFAFAGRGKKTAWATWKSFPEVTDAFIELLGMSNELSEESMLLLERFVVLMYNRTSEVTEVNEARKQLFTQKSRTLENIPPTKAALVQHIRHTYFQANIWNQSLLTSPQIPDPSDLGWVKESNGWQPLWTNLPEASNSCHELIRCRCNKGCTGRCKCAKAALKCTALCLCSGDC